MTRPNSTPRFRPVIRVFVSSTFSDLKQERNALQAQVFPKLEQLCAQNGFQFQAIDLRWGVSSEAGLDHRTMRICFDELKRAQEISPEPNFLVLLGNRYGWRPLPEEISHAEFEQLAAAADSGGENQAPLPGTHGKTARRVLCDWYCCDENVVVPEPQETAPDRAPLNYILQPRTRDLGDGRDYKHKTGDPTKDTQDWIDVQQVLWRIINTAFHAELLDERFDDIDWAQHVAKVNDRQHPKRAIPQIARFQASATEQEIWCGALSAPNAERHVIACFRELGNLEGFIPAELNDFVDITEGRFDASSAKRQSDLKEAIKKRLGENAALTIPFSRLKRENDKVGVDTSAEAIQGFCDKVRARFWSIIEQQILEYWEKSTAASAERSARELKIEQDDHERFGRERGGANSFVGRQRELQAIRDYLKNDSPWPLVVHGASGCGKTALMWRAFEEIPETRKAIIRLIGTTPNSSDVRSLLRSLCQKLRERHPRDGELAADIKALGEELQEHFKYATAEQPLILFLDALDQLSDADSGRLLNWIPAGQLPGHLKLVLSCLSDRAKDDAAGQAFAELMRGQLPAANIINLDALSEDEASTLLFDRWLPQAGRTVSREQRERIEQILKCKECRQPIYLKLLFEEARLWHSYNGSPELGESVPTILGQLIARLSKRANHGPLLVERVLGYLAASRNGLAEIEILEILFRDQDYKANLDADTKEMRHELPANAKRIPIAIWSRLRFDLAPYLAERAAPGANVQTFYHRQVAVWVQDHFLKASEHSWEPHRRLADYFAERWSQHDWHALSELPYHQTHAAQWRQLEQTLGGLAFAEAKCRAGLADDLSDDYQRAMTVLPASIGRDRVAAFRDALARVQTSVAAHPEWSFNHLLWAAEQELPGQDLAGPATRSHPWLRVRSCPLALANREVKVHEAAISSMATSADGRIAISASELGSVKVWDALNSRLLGTLHDDWSNASVLLSEHQIPRVAISGKGTHALTLIPYRGLFHSRIGGGGAIKQVCAERAVRLLGVVLSEDGLSTVLGPSDEGDTYAMWDLANGARLDVPPLSIPAPRRVPVFAADATFSRIVIADGSDMCWVWDRFPRAVGLSAALGHDRVQWAALSRDGRVLVTADAARVVRLFLNAGRQWRPHVLGKHNDQVGGVCVARDGRWAASCGHDGFLRIWSTQSGGWQWETQVILDDDTKLLEAIAAGPGDYSVVVGGHDGICRVIPFDPSQPGNCRTPVGSVTDVASVACDGSAVLAIDMASKGRIEVSSPGGTSLAFETPSISRMAVVSADGKHAAWVSRDMKVCLASLVDGSWRAETLAISVVGDHLVSAVGLTADGSLLVLGFEMNQDRLALCCVRTDPGRDLQATPDMVHLTGDYTSVRALAISDSKRWVALGFLSRKSGVWDRRARSFHPGPDFDDYVSAATIADYEGGFHAAFADASGSVRLCPGRDGTVVVCPSLARNRVLGLAFGCAGRGLTAVSADRWLQVFDTSSGRLLTAFRVPGARVLCCAWDEATGQIAVGQSGAGTVEQWVFEAHDLFLPGPER